MHRQGLGKSHIRAPGGIEKTQRHSQQQRRDLQMRKTERKNGRIEPKSGRIKCQTINISPSRGKQRAQANGGNTGWVCNQAAPRAKATIRPRQRIN
jgi:hypothetical protein